jgi:type III pantothenate kinase
VVRAVCGAVAETRARLAAGAAQVYIAGGAAREIAPHLAAPVEVVDNLVLEGVLALAD